MSELRVFASEILERRGAIVEAREQDSLDVLSPRSVRDVMGWQELERLDFGAGLSERAIRIGLEGDWLQRFGALLGEEGRWAERQLTLSGAPPAPGDPERALGRALDLPNAVWRLHGQSEATARCLLLAFRYTAVSDEKREGMIWLGFNQSTGAVLDRLAERYLDTVLTQTEWKTPDADARAAVGLRWDSATVEARIRPLLDYQTKRELEPFLHAMQRRLERDRVRVHSYHEELWSTSQKRLAALAVAKGEKADSDRRREALRVAGIEREYRSKLEDLRHNYALRVTIEWVQALELYVPVQRFDVLVRRRKGERRISLDWHPLARVAEPPICDWGLGLDSVRLVCDDKLHLTEPAGQAPCTSCGKPWCRACHRAACPRCGKT